MYMMAKTSMLLLALLGYLLAWHRKQLRICFFPIVSISGITLVLYVFGLFGALKSGAYAVVFLGLLLMVRYFSLDGIRDICTDWSILYCAISAVWLYVITRNAPLWYCDDASHWYRICKSVFYEGGYPTTQDIRYYDYVPACATWVSFVSRFIGFNIPNCQFAHNCISIAAASTLFALKDHVERNAEKAIVAGIAALTAFAQCAMTITTYSLVVDAQLGLVAMAAFIYIKEQCTGGKEWLPAVLILSFLSLIKNSALMLILFIVCMTFYTWGKSTGKRKRSLCLIGWVLLPYATYGSYMLRSKIVYSGVAAASQAVSVDRYMALLAEKNTDVIVQTAKAMLSGIFGNWSAGSKQSYCLAIVLILLYLGLKLEGERRASHQIKQVGLQLGTVYVLYSIGMFCTYIFSMSIAEAVTIACFERYFGTLMILVMGVFIYSVVVIAGYLDKGRVLMLELILVFAMLIPGELSRTYALGFERFEHWRKNIYVLWEAIEWSIPQNSFYTEDSYLIVWNDEEYTYQYNGDEIPRIAEAWLRTDDVKAVSASALRSMSPDELAVLAQRDQIALISDLSSEHALLAPYFGDLPFTPGVYEIQNN